MLAILHVRTVELAAEVVCTEIKSPEVAELPYRRRDAALHEMRETAWLTIA